MFCDEAQCQISNPIVSEIAAKPHDFLVSGLSAHDFDSLVIGSALVTAIGTGASSSSGTSGFFSGLFMVRSDHVVV